MGSILLNYLDRIISRRKKLYQIYQSRLADVPGISFSPDPDSEIEYNYAYVPVRVDAAAYGVDRDAVIYEAQDT